MFDEFGILGSRHVEIINEAIADGRVGFAVQPICAASDPDQILYGECLARLTGTDGTIHSAGEFVSYLEALGAAPLIDQHVLGLVLDHLERDPGAILGCNLSADNLGDEALWGIIRERVRTRAHLAPRLVLEFTEARSMPALSLSARLIAEIRDLGCRVALDDFGAGFASPRLVQSIDFDIIKIDKGLVHDIRPSAEGRSSLQNIVGFASSFAPLIIVEGVETAAQVDAARAAGATHFQGHFFSVPVLCGTGHPAHAEALQS